MFQQSHTEDIPSDVTPTFFQGLSYLMLGQALELERPELKAPNAETTAAPLTKEESTRLYLAHV